VSDLTNELLEEWSKIPINTLLNLNGKLLYGTNLQQKNVSTFLLGQSLVFFYFALRKHTNRSQLLKCCPAFIPLVHLILVSVLVVLR